MVLWFSREIFEPVFFIGHSKVSPLFADNYKSVIYYFTSENRPAIRGPLSIPSTHFTYFVKNITRNEASTRETIKTTSPSLPFQNTLLKLINNCLCQLFVLCRPCLTLGANAPNNANNLNIMPFETGKLNMLLRVQFWRIFSSS